MKRYAIREKLCVIYLRKNVLLHRQHGFNTLGKKWNKNKPLLESHPPQKMRSDTSPEGIVFLYSLTLLSPFKHTHVISSLSPSPLREKWLNFLFFNRGSSDWIKICSAWGYSTAEWRPIMALKRGTCIINHPFLSYPWRMRQGNPCLSKHRQ